MSYLKILLGNLLFTGAYAFIAVPKGIVNGGVTSFAMVLGKLTGTDVALLTNALLALLLVACLRCLGRMYFLNALFSGICYMLLFTAFHSLEFELDLPFAVSTLLAAVLVGVGYYLCIAAHSTSVGVDTIALILHKKNPRVNIAAVMYACNVSVLLLGWFAYGWLSIAAGVAFAAIQSLTLNALLRKFGQPA